LSLSSSHLSHISPSKTNDEDNPINFSQLSISCILMSRILNRRRTKSKKKKKVNWKFVCMFKMSKIHRFEWINFQLSCVLSVNYFAKKNLHIKFSFFILLMNHTSFSVHKIFFNRLLKDVTKQWLFNCKNVIWICEREQVNHSIFWQSNIKSVPIHWITWW
jgi:hypothetical protein